MTLLLLLLSVFSVHILNSNYLFTTFMGLDFKEEVEVLAWKNEGNF